MLADIAATLGDDTRVGGTEEEETDAGRLAPAIRRAPSAACGASHGSTAEPEPPAPESLSPSSTREERGPPAGRSLSSVLLVELLLLVTLSDSLPLSALDDELPLVARSRAFRALLELCTAVDGGSGSPKSSSNASPRAKSATDVTPVQRGGEAALGARRRIHAQP